MTSFAGHSLRLVAIGCAMVLPALLAPACSGNPAAGLCRDVCDCEGCSNSEEEACIEAADEALSDAEREGCTEELDAYVDCLEDAFKCDDDNAVFTEDCSDEVEDLSDCGVSALSTGNVCDQAAEACGVSEGEGEPVDCTGTIACQAQCIVDFDCDLTGEAISNCITNC